MIKNRGQIWIETVLYTVVILAIIAIVLSFTIPKLNEGKDKMIIEQSIGALKDFDNSMYDAAKQIGNVRVVEFSLKKGNIYFNPAQKNITLTISGLQSIYSEPGQPIYDGRVIMIFSKGQKTNSINLTLSYTDIEFTYNEGTEEVKLNSASLPYTFSLENAGGKINIKEVYKR